MKRFFHRFYSSFNLMHIVAVAVLFYNNTSLTGNGETIDIFNFFVSFLIYIAITTMLMLFEHKIYYDKLILLTIYSTIGLLFPIFAIINVGHTVRLIVTIIIVLTLLVKLILYSRKHTRFEVNYLTFIPKIYFVIFMSVIVLNVFLSQYIVSIFMIMPILLLEVETYLILRGKDNNADFKLIGILGIIVTAFFISYYSKIDLNENAQLNILTNLIMPLLAMIMVFISTSLINKKIELIIETESVE